MEETEESPSQMNRLQVDGMYGISFAEFNKKRKLQSDQLDLVRPKHKCWVGSFCSEHASMSDENQVLESVHNQMVKIRTDAAFLDERSEPESAKDSNSFMEDSDTAISVNKEAKLDVDTYLYENYAGHAYSEDGKDGAELAIEEEFEDFLLSNGVDPNMYVLSSGRRNVNREAQSSTRPPTIDQEFEEYFSMLML
ncbi:protein FAR-RED ELONGATED HYPOCOTYL 1 isoform X1 [Arachis hypogaea]|uniref:protein FAR-RED ELONGATED HYPOCOTYL 1 isoform X1 n=1 Tax=Arachis hypogaea TaxID=3818 RepID=UPI000DECB224|nr:protein FAR-RED ELONGATED HYPOCOTYL 1 isoform X2 [Arachis hypogaea]